MKLERVIRAVMTEPWLITPQHHYNIQRLLELKLKMTSGEFQARQREGEGVSGEKVELQSMVKRDGVAYIPFAGVLLKGATAFEKASGAIAHEDIEADIAEAIEDPDIEALFFDTDSPGGTAAGSFELADLISGASEIKPTMAWIERLCCSGAYLSLCGATMIYGSKTSEVGAIECYMAWIDASVAFDKAGLRVELVKNTGGTHVGLGFPGHPMTEEQREQLQMQVDQLFQMYVDHVEDERPKVKRSAMAGQTFIGTEARRHGLMDAVTTKAQADRDLRQWAGIESDAQ